MAHQEKLQMVFQFYCSFYTNQLLKASWLSYDYPIPVRNLNTHIILLTRCKSRNIKLKGLSKNPVCTMYMAE